MKVSFRKYQTKFGSRISTLQIVFLQFRFTIIFIKGFLLNIAILFAVLIWRRFPVLDEKAIWYASRVHKYLEKSPWIVCHSSHYLTFTMNYGGAIGEFFPDYLESNRINLSFGVNSLLLTTLQVAFGALIIAVPLGVGTAIYLSEYAHPRLVAIVKPTLKF